MNTRKRLTTTQADHTSVQQTKKKPAAETKTIEVVKSDDKDYPTNGVEAKEGDEP